MVNPSFDQISALETNTLEPSGYEPELGGLLRQDDPERSGFEPELGGALRQNAVYVDETTCIGCGHCSHVARGTFYLEPSYGRARVVAQDGDAEETIQEAIDTCPVDCIHWVNYNQLNRLEEAREQMTMQNLGIIGDGAALRRSQNRFRPTDHQDME
ncbi:MAG: ferredoxin [Pseudanabaenaceae cyanobacterium]|jgi:ferredoxin